MLKFFSTISHCNDEHDLPDGMKLEQRGINGGPQTLGNHHSYMLSGDMNGCYAGFILANRAIGGGSYNLVRGQHGAGGPTAIDFDELLQGVTNQPNAVFIGSCKKSDAKSYHAQVDKILTEKGFSNNVGNRIYKDFANIFVYRSGETASAQMLDIENDEYHKKQIKLLGGSTANLGEGAFHG